MDVQVINEFKRLSAEYKEQLKRDGEDSEEVFGYIDDIGKWAESCKDLVPAKCVSEILYAYINVLSYTGFSEERGDALGNFGMFVFEKEA